MSLRALVIEVEAILQFFFEVRFRRLLRRGVLAMTLFDPALETPERLPLLVVYPELVEGQEETLCYSKNLFNNRF